jgi:diguanylate cyclase (GGDEF)-like protein
MRRWPCLLLWSLLMLLGAAGHALAQRDPLDTPRFVTVTDSRSISDQVVTALAQDDAGLIWVGTPAGLLRFDGYHLRPHPVGAALGQAPTSTSFVRVLLPAPDGVLWVGLEGEGLARLDTRRHAWTLHRAEPARPGALAHGSVRALALERDGTLWVGTTGGGLHRLAPGADRFEHHRRADGSLPDDRVQALHVDRQGALWVGTWAGLVRRGAGETAFAPVPGLPGAPGQPARVISLIGEATDGRLWVGTRQGDLWLLDPATGLVQALEPSAPHAGAAAPARRRAIGDAAGGMAGGLGGVAGGAVAMVAADEREVWIGRDNGLELRDAATGALQHFLQRDLRKPWGLGGSNVAALLRDRTGALWVGSYGGGLQRHSPPTALWVRRGEGRDNSVMAEADTRALLPVASGEIWVGLHERGLAVLDERLRLVAELPVQPDGSPGHTGGQVGGMAQRTDGTVFVGTDTGVHAFSPQRRWLARYSAGQGRARRLLATADGAVWVGSQDGVHRLAAPAQAFARLTLADGSPVTGNVNALAEAPDGSVWVGGNAGLYRVAPGGDVLDRVVSPPDGALRKQVVLGVLVDRRGQLWVDTNAGLHRAVSVRGAEVAFEHVGDQDGGSVGANLLDDAQGRIWTHQTVFDPASGRLHRLGEPDGVDIGTGWFRSYAALPDGRLLFGGSTGILVADPARFEPWVYPPQVVATELRVAGERQPVQRLAPALVLPPAERGFSVEFAALDFGDPGRNRYRWRLLGVDADWQESDANQRVAAYSNLAPGRYRLIVMGSNRNGAWSDRVLDVPVHVQPAWWQTGWAYAGAALLLALALIAVVQVRTRWLRLRQAELEEKVAERTQELQRLSAELQRQAQALAASSVTDPLTGLHNRRFLNEHLPADVARTVRQHADALQRGQAPPAEADIVFFVIDIDHFKQVNDEHGHAAGDAVLVQMRQRLQQAFRQGDYLVRWGGEEFLIAARGLPRERAAELAERAREAVAKAPFVLDDGTHLARSCSVGFAAFPPAPGQPLALDWTAAVDLADAALFVVKRHGRDGWLGLVYADAADASTLRRAVGRPLAEWLPRAGSTATSPSAVLQGSPRLQAWLAAARRGADADVPAEQGAAASVSSGR